MGLLLFRLIVAWLAVDVMCTAKAMPS